MIPPAASDAPAPDRSESYFWRLTMSDIIQALVEMENQTPMVVPSDIAGDDAKLKAYLAPHVENIRTATFSRETKEGRMMIKIVKHGYSLGSVDDVLTVLDVSHDGLNPVVALAIELKARKPGTADVLALQPRIQATLAEGERLHDELTAMLRCLDATEPDPASVVPLGI
jgi:hypothetical protein